MKIGVEETLKEARIYCIGLRCYKENKDKAVEITVNQSKYIRIEPTILKWYIDAIKKAEEREKLRIRGICI